MTTAGNVPPLVMRELGHNPEHANLKKELKQMELFPIVFEQDGQALTTSREIADYFGKEHRGILRDIRKTLEQLDQTEEGRAFGQHNFVQSYYTNEQNKKQPLYVLTRDGFTLLAMGFTGARAMQFKVAYINAFNRMAGMISAAKGAKKRAAIDTADSETALFLQAIARATQSGEYVIVGQYARSWRGKLLGIYTSDQIRLFADTAYKLYCECSEKPLTRRQLYAALADEGIAEPHRNHKPRAIKGTRRSGIILYRQNEATADIALDR